MSLPKARLERVLIKQVDDDTIFYDLDNHKATSLNASAAEIWQLSDGTRTPEDIAENMELTDPGPVIWTLRQLQKAGLLEQNDPLPAGPTRREAIRQIATGTRVAMALAPSVVAITVPTAAQAASCGAHGSPCSGASDCCSGVCDTWAGFCVG